MHSIVQVTCPSCGDIELAPHDIQLRVCSTQSASSYVFTCTRCEQIVVKAASDGRVITLLSSVGVPTFHWDLPAELEEVKEGPAITVDDLIDFHFALQRPDWATLLPAAS